MDRCIFILYSIFVTSSVVVFCIIFISEQKLFLLTVAFVPELDGNYVGKLEGELQKYLNGFD